MKLSELTDNALAMLMHRDDLPDEEANENDASLEKYLENDFLNSDASSSFEPDNADESLEKEKPSKQPNQIDLDYQYFALDEDDSLLEELSGKRTTKPASASTSSRSSSTGSSSSSTSSDESDSSSDLSSNTDEDEPPTNPITSAYLSQETINKKSFNSKSFKDYQELKLELKRPCLTNLTNHCDKIRVDSVDGVTEEQQSDEEAPDFTRLYEFDTSIEEPIERTEDDALVKQMTPPKSVESVVNTQPSSNSSLFAKTILANTSMMPPSYDDLNNIFEEDSADDEQLKQDVSVASGPIPTLSAFTTGPPNHPSKSSCLSVVMTPPSHENMAPSSSNAHDDSPLPSIANHQDTRSIKLNDYMTIVNEGSRVDFSALLLNDFTSLNYGNYLQQIPNKFDKLNKVKFQLEIQFLRCFSNEFEIFFLGKSN